MEDPLASCVLINEYILHGKGGLYSLVTAKKYDGTTAKIIRNKL
jgi:hypothetical protein